MIRKAVVMAAGKGTRMLPLTKDVPKHLIGVAGRPFLGHLLDRLMDAGFADIAIVVGYKRELIKQFLEENDYEAHLIDQVEPLGTGHALLLAEKWAGQSQFVALGGDNLWSSRDLRAVAPDDDFCYISAAVAPDPSKFGVLEVKDGFLVRIHEKPKDPVGSLVNTGLYKFTPEIFEALGDLKPSPRGEIELTDAISALSANKKVRVVKVSDYWLDLGSIEDIPRVEEALLKLRGKPL